MLKFSRVPQASCNFPQNLEVNLGSLSDMIDIANRGGTGTTKQNQNGTSTKTK